MDTTWSRFCAENYWIMASNYNDFHTLNWPDNQIRNKTYGKGGGGGVLLP